MYARRMRAMLVAATVLLMACPAKPPAPPPPPADVECEGPPPTPEHTCVQDCGPPVVRDGDPPPAWHWLSPEEVEARNQGGCPRCLPPQARIATPDGDVAIVDLHVGDRVLTVDAAGRRVEARVLHLGSRPARVGHAMMRLTLGDGRVVTGSPEHPVGDGRLLQAVRAGDAVDGARVVGVEVVPFAGDRTWDLFPSGPTGLYIADGVVLRSTLDPHD